MGILNTVESMASGPAADTHRKVAAALMEELEQGAGAPGLIQAFQRNGVGAHAEEWMRGNTQPNPTSIENGLAGTGLIERIAERTGLSDGTVRGALALIVPVVVHHFVSNGYVSPTGEVLAPQPNSRSLLDSVLSRVLP